MLMPGKFAFIFGAKAELRIELLNGCIKQYETNHIYLGPSNVISFHQWEYLLRSICQPPKIVGTSSSWSKVQNSVMWITILKSKSIISKSHQGSWETFTSEKSQEDQVDRHEERISEIAEGSWRGDRGQNEATGTTDEKN